MLYIVPTPIGNIEDITFRAVKILKEVDLILAEDTRNSSKLLKHYDISTRMISFHSFNEHKMLKNIIEQLKTGQEIALISDAGTPGISDPGFLLVRECIENEIKVTTLPGAVALIPALVNSGFSSDKFYFEGFLPHKKGRKKRLEFIATLPCSVILYESPYRIEKLLEQLIEVIGENRYVSVSRELTKMFEQNIQGTLKELSNYYKENKPKGEFVVVIKGFNKQNDDDSEE